MQITESKRYEIAEVFGMIGEGDLLRRDSRLKKSKDIEVDGFMVHPISLRYGSAGQVLRPRHWPGQPAAGF